MAERLLFKTKNKYMDQDLFDPIDQIDMCLQYDQQQSISNETKLELIKNYNHQFSLSLSLRLCDNEEKCLTSRIVARHYATSFA
jgi:hypothetical protein